MLAGGAAIGLKLYYAPFMKHHAIWATAILAVYLFSVSGGMHNIIRGVPMQTFDRNTGQVRLAPLLLDFGVIAASDRQTTIRAEMHAVFLLPVFQTDRTTFSTSNHVR